MSITVVCAASSPPPPVETPSAMAATSPRASSWGAGCTEAAKSSIVLGSARSRLNAVDDISK